MHHLRQILSTASICAIVACTGDAEESKPAASAELTLRERADSLMAQVVDAINSADVATVAALTAHVGEDPNEAMAREALVDFRHHFAGRPVIRANFVREHGGDGPPPRSIHFEYALLTRGGIRKPVVAYYDERTESFRVYDEFLGYSARARALARGVVESIRARDAARLARYLSPDDIDYPVPMAERIIASYARKFDLGTLKYRFDGLTPERKDNYGPQVNRWFRYTLYGSKGSKRVTHPVEIIHGDGLVGWRDPLVPEPPQP